MVFASGVKPWAPANNSMQRTARFAPPLMQLVSRTRSTPSERLVRLVGGDAPLKPIEYHATNACERIGEWPARVSRMTFGSLR